MSRFRSTIMSCSSAARSRTRGGPALDSLRLLTPNWQSRLPDHAYEGPDPTAS
jgi:hypothetical protein